METVGSIVEEKGSVVYVIPPDATAHAAVQMMCERRVGALLVATTQATLGIVSERDVLVRLILEHRDPQATPVSEVMTRAVVCVSPTTTAREAMAVMTERRCRHLPVVTEGAIVGIVSIGDLVRAASREQEFQLRMLTEYVHGGYG